MGPRVVRDRWVQDTPAAVEPVKCRDARVVAVTESLFVNTYLSIYVVVVNK